MCWARAMEKQELSLYCWLREFNYGELLNIAKLTNTNETDIPTEMEYCNEYLRLDKQMYSTFKQDHETNTGSKIDLPFSFADEKY